MKRPSLRSVIGTAGILALAFILFSTAAFSQFRSRLNKKATGVSVKFKHEGLDREYRIHFPKSIDESKPVPLVVCLHGGGGNSEQGSAMGMTPVADRHGFIVVYPGAINKHWNDGRNSQLFLEQDKTTDDVSFIAAIVDRICSEHVIDRNRIFATGLSNGGFMSQRLAIDKSEIFSAVGIVIASMGEPLKTAFEPKLPVSVLYMNGTEDPLVPYAGGPIQVNFFPRLNRTQQKDTAPRGRCIPTDDAVQLWVQRNGISKDPQKEDLADRDVDDGSTITRSLWTGGEMGTAVALYKVVGGGHAIPGGIQYLPERIIGRTNRDVDGFEEIWTFFTKHARKN